MSTKKKPSKKRKATAKPKRKIEELHEIHKALEGGDVFEMESWRILAAIEMKPGVEEILRGNEAKLYLGGIQRARAKLQAVIDRELALRNHPGHPDHEAKT